MKTGYPTIVRRYAATLIDGFVVLALLLCLALLLQGSDNLSIILRVSAIIAVILVYEPFLTSFKYTLGQYAMGIRVRDHRTLAMITLPKAYLRIVVKVLLGLYSFFSIIWSEEHRAVHDYAAGTVVVNAA
jgi:uncharacterized RDD family membrane protein YckC